MALAAVQEALSPNAAGTDRNLGLGDVIAGAEWVALGIEEDVDTFALITVHHRVDDRRSDRNGSRWRGEEPPWQSGKEHDRDAAQQDHDASAEVGLNQDQECRNTEQQERGPDRAPFADLGRRYELVEAGEGEHDCWLHEFGRLKADRP